MCETVCPNLKFGYINSKTDELKVDSSQPLKSLKNAPRMGKTEIWFHFYYNPLITLPFKNVYGLM